MNEPSAQWKVQKIENGRATLKNLGRDGRPPHKVDAQPDWKEGDIVVDTYRGGANVLELLA